MYSVSALCSTYFILGFSVGVFTPSLKNRVIGGLSVVQDGSITIEGFIHFSIPTIVAAVIYCSGYLIWRKILGFKWRNQSD